MRESVPPPTEERAYLLLLKQKLIYDERVTDGILVNMNASSSSYFTIPGPASFMPCGGLLCMLNAFNKPVGLAWFEEVIHACSSATSMVCVCTVVSDIPQYLL